MRREARGDQIDVEIQLEDGDLEELDRRALDSTELESAQRVIAPTAKRPSSVPPPIPSRAISRPSSVPPPIPSRASSVPRPKHLLAASPRRRAS